MKPLVYSEGPRDHGCAALIKPRVASVIAYLIVETYNWPVEVEMKLYLPDAVLLAHRWIYRHPTDRRSGNYG